MLALGIVLNTVGLALFCWLIFALAVYAVPFFVAVSIGMLTFHSGAGVYRRAPRWHFRWCIDARYGANRFRNDAVDDLACGDRGRFRRPGRHCRLSCGSRDVADRTAFPGLA